MSGLIQPRGALPARVYWVRRALVLTLALLLFLGLGRLLGGGDAETKADDTATTVSSSSKSSEAPAANPFIGPTPFVPAPAPKGKPQGNGTTVQPAQQPAGPLAQPSGPCAAQTITVTPALISARAGQAVRIPLDFTGTEPACTFEVDDDSLVLKIGLDGQRFWTTQQCPKAITKQQIVVRATQATRVFVTWSGRRSDEDCSSLTKWALPDTYQIDAAVIGSEPSATTFRLDRPPRPVITQTATPEPEVKGKQTKCGGDIASNSC